MIHPAIMELAQQNNDAGAAAVAAAPLVFMLSMICIGLVISLAISAAICYFLSSTLKRIPPEHRKQTPGMVWLLMIPVPLWTLIWNFFVYPKVAESFQSYFSALGRTDVGDCGRQLSFIFCIACIFMFIGVIPCIGLILGPVVDLTVLVLFIIVMVKFGGLRSQLPPAAANLPA
jgi:hypothetical protein